MQNRSVDGAFCVPVKAAQDPCYHYVCIYLKSMHELRRLKPTANEIFMKFISKRSLYQ